MDWYFNVLKKYSAFSGRETRRDYWMFILFNGILAMVALILDNVLRLTVTQAKFGVFYLVVVLTLLVPTLSATSRRLHDTNKSFWWSCLFFIPVVGFIWLVVLLVKEGNLGTNKYGDSPLYKEIDDDEIDESEGLDFENDSNIGDTIILLVVIWMVLSRLFFAVAPKLSGTLYTSHWFDMVNTIIGLMWTFVPFGLAFAVKNRTKQMTLFILGGVYLFYGLYDVVFSLIGK